nr:hypothetical protein CFP56_75501 [Quercus suber]
MRRTYGMGQREDRAARSVLASLLCEADQGGEGSSGVDGVVYVLVVAAHTSRQLKSRTYTINKQTKTRADWMDGRTMVPQREMRQSYHVLAFGSRPLE